MNDINQNNVLDGQRPIHAFDIWVARLPELKTPTYSVQKIPSWLANVWSEEVWQGLSSLANRKRIPVLDECDDVSVLPKISIVIVVDTKNICLIPADFSLHTLLRSKGIFVTFSSRLLRFSSVFEFLSTIKPDSFRIGFCSIYRRTLTSPHAASKEIEQSFCARSTE